MARQIIYRGFLRGLAVFSIMVLCAAPAFPENPRVYQIGGLAPGSSAGAKRSFTREELEALGVQTVASSYFDRAMNYRGSRLRTISLSRLAEKMSPGGEADALLLDCFDDYQGIVSLEDVKRYDLRLATEIEVLPEFKKPGWLNPLLIVVPDGSRAPYQERFMTANIRELRFVRLEDYYAPLREISLASASMKAGLRVFQDNCIFCHSLKGIGGNKGVRLLAAYDFSSRSGQERFRADFAGFHGKDNPDKQNIQQFVAGEALEKIIEFLKDPRLAR